MAWLIRPLRRILSSPCLRAVPLRQHPDPTSFFSSRSISGMRNAAFQDKMLRLLRQEIQYEHERSAPKQPINRFNSFTVDDRPSEQWIKLKRKFGEKEDITIDATMFDGSVPVSSSDETQDSEQLHMTFIVNISKGGDGNILEIVCSAWPDTIEIKKVYVREHNRKPGYPYLGPEFDIYRSCVYWFVSYFLLCCYCGHDRELDEELQDPLYEFMEERSINDELAIFLHEYMGNKYKTEFIRWLETVKTCIEKK
ncbi:DNA ligase 1-like [Hibiscus syriacus]|uniref:DNA ligase 1-like n=1 Tax=Hibiscus syriacus TaxID=106335 RepID=A0A6A2Z9D2_HIBSY|nr:DNA ligase 1-like [Hibiscus syriacus]